MKPLLNRQSNLLQKLMSEAELFQALLEVGQACLPDELQPHLVGVGFEDGVLVLQIDDNLWATQLRFFEPNLLNIYRDHFPHLGLRKTKIKVLPLAEPPEPKRKVSTSPSTEDAKAMQALANQVESKGLQAALLKLSQRAEPTSESD